jgi:hypothetical protein
LGPPDDAILSLFRCKRDNLKPCRGVGKLRKNPLDIDEPTP